MGAALSFFTLLSLVPMLLIGFSIAGYIFGERAAQGELIAQLPALVGAKAADEVDSLIRTFRFTQHQGLTAISYVVALIVGALSVFGELQRALERIWKTQRSKDAPSWWRFLVVKAFSIGMVLLIGLSFIGLIAAGALLNDLMRELKYVPPLDYVLGLLWDTLVFCGTASLFAIVFRYGPKERVAWRDVWVGGIVTALLFTTGKVLIAMFLGHRPLTSGYGAAGSFIGLLLWIYYSSLIFLYGAEFTYAYSQASAAATAPTPL
jgi:membrane protein